jgi:DNA-binding NarL/FixJ family response regulator
LKTVVLIENHRVLRAALKTFLEAEPSMTVVGEAGKAAQALALADHFQPDSAILDFSQNAEINFGLIARIQALSPPTQVIVYSLWVEILDRPIDLSIGTCVFISKLAAPAQLVEAILQHPAP